MGLRRYELRDNWSFMIFEMTAFNDSLQRKVIFIVKYCIWLYLRSRTQAATMLYAINVPMDIISTSSLRSNIRVMRAANEENHC
jgi:hypothetical protein